MEEVIDEQQPPEVVAVGVPFMFGTMLLYGRLRHGRFSLWEVVRFRRPMPLWQYATLYVPMLAFAFVALFATQPLSPFLAERVFYWLPPYLLPSWEQPVAPAQGLILFALLAKLLFDGLTFPILAGLDTSKG